MIRSRTSRMSAMRSAIRPPSAASAFSWTTAVSQTARAALRPFDRTSAVASDTSSGSDARSREASRIALVSPVACAVREQS